MADYRINKLMYNNDLFVIKDRPFYGNGFGVCNVASGALTVTISDFEVTNGSIVTILFNYDVPTAATLNINQMGDKNIYYRNNAISNQIILAGDLVTFIYSNDIFYVIGIDRKEISWETDVYKPGDEIVFTTIYAPAVITATRTMVRWSLQVDKPFSNEVAGFRIDQIGTFILYGNNDTIFSYSGLANIPGTFGQSANHFSEAGIRFDLIKENSGTWTSNNNNYTYILYASNLTLTLLNYTPT